MALYSANPRAANDDRDIRVRSLFLMHITCHSHSLSHHFSISEEWSYTAHCTSHYNWAYLPQVKLLIIRSLSCALILVVSRPKHYVRDWSWRFSKIQCENRDFFKNCSAVKENLSALFYRFSVHVLMCHFCRSLYSPMALRSSNSNALSTIISLELLNVWTSHINCDHIFCPM